MEVIGYTINRDGIRLLQDKLAAETLTAPVNEKQLKLFLCPFNTMDCEPEQQEQQQQSS